MSEYYEITQPEIDRKDKAILWIALDVLEQGQGNAKELYEILEQHFMLKSKWAYRNFDEPTFTLAQVKDEKRKLVEEIADEIAGLGLIGGDAFSLRMKVQTRDFIVTMIRRREV